MQGYLSSRRKGRSKCKGDTVNDHNEVQIGRPYRQGQLRRGSVLYFYLERSITKKMKKLNSFQKIIFSISNFLPTFFLLEFIHEKFNHLSMIYLEITI